MNKRIKEDWIDSFIQSVSLSASPKLFQKWAGISIIAGALERKVWVDNAIGILYPNLYVVTVAPPGVGKTLMTVKVREYWEELDKAYVSAMSMTSASLIDELHDSQKTLIKPQVTPSTITYNSLLISVNELGDLLQEYDKAFMVNLTNLYDCHKYTQRRRGKDLHYEIPHTQINIFSGGVPTYFVKSLPEHAWEEGFLSRTLLIYSGEINIVDIFAKKEKKKELNKELVKDLQTVSNMYGEMEFSIEAKSAFGPWHLGGNAPNPIHPKLQHYNTRRSAHLLKLCMVASASRNDDLVITIGDYRRAFAWLLEAEAAMPDLFKAMASGGRATVMAETEHFILEAWLQNKKQPVPEYMLVRFLATKIPTMEIPKFIELLITGKHLRKKVVPGVGICYEPVGKKF